MKPFDLEAAMRGEPIVTRDGRKVKFVAYIPEAEERYRVVMFAEGSKHCVSYSEDGKYYSAYESSNDLFMAPPPMRSINGYEYPKPEKYPLKRVLFIGFPTLTQNNLYFRMSGESK